jgi:hypothetical protein
LGRIAARQHSSNIVLHPSRIVDPSPDEEEEGDEEMENVSGSEEGGSRGDEESMEM